MSIEYNTREYPTLSPDEAFAALGNETRLQILRTLGAADGPLAFGEIFDRIEYEDSSNFDYHLKQLVGHFISKTDAGYVLRQAGQRVVEAVLSGAITDDTILEPTRVDRACPFCAASIRVAFQQERVEMHCTECPGMGPGDYKDPETDRFKAHGNLGHLLLPPAGIDGRTASEVLGAAERWTTLQVGAVARGICPRCSAAVTYSTLACAEHAVGDNRCEQCERRFAAMFSATCTNCIFELEAPVATYLASHTDVVSFIIDHGVDPVSPDGFNFLLSNVEESIRSTDPFEARFTFTTTDERLVLSVDDDLSVSDVSRTRTTAG